MRYRTNLRHFRFKTLPVNVIVLCIQLPLFILFGVLGGLWEGLREWYRDAYEFYEVFFD